MDSCVDDDGRRKPRSQDNSSNKASRKLKKSLQSLAKHDPEVKVSESPTQYLFVANSSVLCGVPLEELEQIFLPFDENCTFLVYPDRRSYSFVQFSSPELASRARKELHGAVPSGLGLAALPFYIVFVKNLPATKKKDELKRPGGLLLYEDFVTEGEESSLMECLRDCFDAKKKLKYRSVVHFGYQFNYDTNEAFAVDDKPIPSCCEPVIGRMLERGILKERPDQLTVNVYDPGNGIPSHVDTHSAFGDSIASLSLMSGLVMEFRDFANTAAVTDVFLPRFSLAVMQGESRYRWKHGIAKRKYDINPEDSRLIRRQFRVSFTFRKIASEKCQCEFIEYCDWDRNGAMKIPSEEKHGKTIENEYVASVYESIAEHFDSTRHSQWVAVKKFLDELPPGTILYDVGCGNGKYLIKEDELIKFGCDYSENLCVIARNKNCEVLRADALALPYRSESADAIISIAVIHHMSTEKRRLTAVSEILRCLRSGGRACITVWSLEQEKDNVVSEYLKMRSHKSKVPNNRRDSHGRLRVHEGKDFTQQDMLVPWQNTDGKHFLRYYHLFVAGELEELVNKTGSCVVEHSDYEQGNWIVTIRKL